MPPTAIFGADRIAYTVPEAAQAIGVCTAQIRRMCSTWRATRGRAGLRHARLGARCIRISRDDLLRLVQSSTSF